MRKTCPTMAVFEDESGPEPPDTGRPLEAGKGKETGFIGASLLPFGPSETHFRLLTSRT